VTAVEIGLFREPAPRVDSEAVTPSSILVIVVGIVLALLVSYVLGIIVILIGLAMLLVPAFGGARRV